MNDTPRKPRVLTRLRIDEVSTVDRGAGHECRVVISKRDDDYPGASGRGRIFDLLTGRTTIDKLYNIPEPDESDAVAKSDNRGDEAERIDAPPSKSVTPKKHREISFDLPDGTHLKFPNQRALAEWLAIQQRIISKSTSTSLQDFNMTTPESKLREIAKTHGVATIAKITIADQKSYGISQDELVELISNHDRQDGESAAKCFSRHYGADTADGLALRKAVEITKSAPFEDDSAAEAEADSRAAMDELVAIGKQRWPSLSRSAQFARAFETNPEIAKRAMRKPSMLSTSYPFPRR